MGKVKRHCIIAKQTLLQKNYMVVASLNQFMTNYELQLSNNK